MRYSLKNNVKSNIFSMEPPDVTGSSLTLGTAGSRRTVYLLEDNARKLAENNNATSSPSTTNPTTSGTSKNSTIPDNHSPPSTSAGATPESGPATNAASASAPPSTFLMFNRISNVLGGPVDAMGQPLLDNSGSAFSEKQSSEKTKDKKENGKQTAVWYEYGCV